MLSMEWHGEGWKLLFMVPWNARMRGTRWSWKIAVEKNQKGVMHTVQWDVEFLANMCWTC